MLNSDIKEREKYIICRKRKNIKLSDVAKYIGVSIVSISRFERYLMNLKEENENKYKEFIQVYQFG